MWGHTRANIEPVNGLIEHSVDQNYDNEYAHADEYADADQMNMLELIKHNCDTDDAVGKQEAS